MQEAAYEMKVGMEFGRVLVRSSEVFTVTLSEASATTVTATYGTHDDTALGGTDYTSGSPTATFAPGTTSTTITVATRSEEHTSELQSTFNHLSRLLPASHATGNGAVRNGTAHDGNY